MDDKNKKPREDEEILRASEEFFHSMVENAVEGMFRTTPEGKFIYANTSLSRIFGFNSVQEFLDYFIDIGKQHYRNPEDREIFKKTLERDGIIEGFETQLVDRKGNFIWASINARVVKDDKKKDIYYEGTITDVNKRKLAEEEVKKLLAEKEILLREVHHRMKNNMNVLISLLSLQAETMHDQSAIDALKEAGNRIKSMMVLYDKLYRSSDFREISARDYLSSLADEIIENFPNRSLITFEKKINDRILDVKVLSVIGMIITELLTNTMKHAFIRGEKGVIKISLSSEGNQVALVFQDDGVGIPEAVDIGKSTGFGLYVVGELTEQLKGTIRIERGEGTCFILEFKV